MQVTPAFITCMAAVLFSFGSARADASLTVEGARFVLQTPDGAELTSEHLVGAIIEIADGHGGLSEVRIDAVSPARERADILLHDLSVRTADGGWTPLCGADAYGRKAGFPMRGSWDGLTYSADTNAWFLACTSGSQGKCALWGYGPWDTTPDGRPMTDFYRACQQAARADYQGRNEPHTRDGTAIDIADVAGVQTHATLGDRAFVFEAGWNAQGAVCVAATRWPELISRDRLVVETPELGGPCDEAEARAKGALLFTRIKAR